MNYNFQGDSGSALIVNEQLVAIASWIIPCALGKPDIYIRIFDYISYIETILQI
jgi:hypothetical protein